MSIYGLQHHFPFDVQPAENGKVALTLEIEAIHVKTFLTMLESLSDFFRIINNKSKVSLAYVRQPEIYASGAKYYEEYTSAVIDTFKVLRKESTLSARELITATNQNIKNIYPNSCYNLVKQILTKSGELKKNGFYKKNL